MKGKLIAMASVGAESVKGLIDESITAALQSGFSEVSNGYVTILKVALPSALTVFAISFALRRGISFFRGIAG